MTLKAILLSATTIALKANLTGQLKTIYIARWGDTLTYHYDDQGRISEITSDRGYRSVYEYKGNIIRETTAGGSTITMYLNSRGLIDSLVDIDSNRGHHSHSGSQWPSSANAQARDQTNIPLCGRPSAILQ